MDKTISNFLLGQTLSLLLSLSIVKREIIVQTVQTQILLEIVFDICLFSFSLVATRVSQIKTRSPNKRLVVLAACAALAGDNLFFYSLNFMCNYMCTFFDELNYPISLVAEYLVYGQHIPSFMNVISYVVLLLITVGMCFMCNKDEFHFHQFGIITGVSFNVCYILVAFLQKKLTPAMGIFGFTKACSICRLAITSLSLICTMVFWDLKLEEIAEFFSENVVNVLFSSIFYAAFYVLAAVHIEKFGVSMLFANLISSSIYVVLINKLLVSSPNVLLVSSPNVFVVFGTTLVCLGLIYILVKNGKKERVAGGTPVQKTETQEADF